jgi:hypothetical protein
LGEQYKQHGLGILDIGLHSHAGSPRLLESKAEYYQLVGDRANATHFRQAASDRARAVVSLLNDEYKQEGEEVLNELRLKSDPRR